MGGLNGTRDASLDAGGAVTEALRQAGHDAWTYDVQDPDLPGLRSTQPDVAFLAIPGEDGTVRQRLDTMGMPYTGSSPETSRLVLDAPALRRLLAMHSVPTPACFRVDEEAEADPVSRRAEQIGYPLACRPAGECSGGGANIAWQPADLSGTLAAARRRGGAVLVERLIRGRKFSTAVFEGQPLPLVERMDVRRREFAAVVRPGLPHAGMPRVVELVVSRDWRGPVLPAGDGNACYITPVELLPTVYRKASETSVRAYRALGCRHVAVVDLLYGHDGTVYVLDVKTVPDLRPSSPLPVAAKADGFTFPELCHLMVCAAAGDAGRQMLRPRAGMRA